MKRKFLALSLTFLNGNIIGMQPAMPPMSPTVPSAIILTRVEVNPKVGIPAPYTSIGVLVGIPLPSLGVGSGLPIFTPVGFHASSINIISFPVPTIACCYFAVPFLTTVFEVNSISLSPDSQCGKSGLRTTFNFDYVLKDTSGTVQLIREPGIIKSQCLVKV